MLRAIYSLYKKQQGQGGWGGGSGGGFSQGIISTLEILSSLKQLLIMTIFRATSFTVSLVMLCHPNLRVSSLLNFINILRNELVNA